MRARARAHAHKKNKTMTNTVFRKASHKSFKEPIYFFCC